MDGNTVVSYHHVLEKSKYPEYTLSDWNIVLVSPEVHDQVHKDIDKTPKIKELRNKLLKLHRAGELPF